jgi:photosystem II stability/assembly factor-like uncharacterized protein
MLVAGCIAIAVHAPAHAAGVVEPPARPAILSSIAGQSVLLDVAKAGNRLVAVGERGIVLLSDDSGQSWRQARVPVSVTLTAVHFPTEKKGWAVGHYGIVLHSEDGGESWVRQMDGVTAAKLVLDAAQARVNRSGNDPAAQKQLAEAQRMVSEGPDKPFLDLYFENDKSGLVVGAYNLMLRTDDGGKTWHAWSEHLDNPKAAHLYAIRGAGSTLVVAGELGLVLRSTDGGKSFARLETPYKGSYFTAALLPSGEIVVAGLRGNAYRSADQGGSWEKIDVPVPVSLTSVVVGPDNTLILANQAGQLFASHDRGRSLQALALPPMPPVNDVLPLADGSLVVAGMRGAIRLPPTAASSKEGAKP